MGFTGLYTTWRNSLYVQINIDKWEYTSCSLLHYQGEKPSVRNISMKARKEQPGDNPCNIYLLKTLGDFSQILTAYKLLKEKKSNFFCTFDRICAVMSGFVGNITFFEGQILDVIANSGHPKTSILVYLCR